MPLECVMFCLDTSSYMRNGDLNPTRLGAQQQSIGSLSRYKLDDNVETSVGLLTMAGAKVEVQISPSRELHKLLNCLKVLQPQGSIDIPSALRISQLTLRNRSNKHQKQRIIMFIGSPITLDDEQILQMGKELKKNQIALDLVLFGYETIENNNITKAKLLIDTVQNSNNSRLVIHYDPTLVDLEKDANDEIRELIHPNPSNTSLSDLVLRSPLGRNIQPIQPRVVAPVLTPAQQQPMANMVDADEEEMDEDLLAAIALSQMEFNTNQDALPAAVPVTNNNNTMEDVVEEDEEEMDEDLLAALQLSLQMEAEEQAAATAATNTEKPKEDEVDDFDALMEAVSGGAVTKDDDDKEKKE